MIRTIVDDQASLQEVDPIGGWEEALAWVSDMKSRFICEHNRAFRATVSRLIGK